MSIDFSSYPALVAAARYGLGAYGVCGPVPRIVVSPDLANRVIGLARFDHITGLLGQATVDGAIEFDDQHHEQLMESWQQELRACVMLEALIIRTSELLESAGVSFVLTKGAALAHLDYPDASWRTFGDVDLVIHPDNWSSAVTALVAAGCSREGPTIPRNYDDRYGKGATLTTPEGFQIDLHRRLAIGRFGVTARMQDLFETLETVHLGGYRIPVMTANHRLLHACYHAALGGFRRLRAFRDVAQLSLAASTNLDIVYETARSWKAESVVTAAVVESWERLRLNKQLPSYERAASQRIGTLDARALRVFAEHRPFRAQALTTIGRIGPLDTLRFLWALKPSSESGAP